MVVEQFKKLWLPRGVDFMIVPELSADHCTYDVTTCPNTITRVSGMGRRFGGLKVICCCKLK